MRRKQQKQDLCSCSTSQRGVSLLMALTLVVVVTSVITGVALTTNYALRRSAVLSHGQQAAAYADGAVSLAEQLLQVDSFSSNSDDINEAWAQTLPAYPVEGGEVRGRIHELSSRFNLAMLADENPFEVDVFKRLWETLGGAQQIANAIVNAVRSGQYASVIGAFVAAGVDEMAIHQRAMYFNYLPINVEKLNINLVSPQVFAAYFEVTLSRATEILSTLKDNPLRKLTDLKDFANQHHIAHLRVDSNRQNAPSVIELRFDVKSRYFQVVGEATLGEARAVSIVTVDRGRQHITRLSKRLSKLVTE